ncbi:MAG: NAD(P)H-quinone oxidoreductase [Thermoanaerobaculia bacterium]
MKAVIVERPGPEDVLHIGDVEPPPLGPRQLRIRVSATAVNRADLLQREGHYPPPPGATPILGLECAGTVAEIGAEVRGWRVGERAMALLPGGGYAEEAVADAGSVMHVPTTLSDVEAAAVPETFLTAFLNIFELARAAAGESILIHGGGSGVGTAATTLCKLAGLLVIVTAGSKEKCDRCLAHGADVAINYTQEDFSERAAGVNIVLDHLGANYLIRDLRALAVDGRVVLIGSMGGDRMANLDVGAILMKRQQIIGSTLRSRSAESKASIVAHFLARFGGDLEEGRIKPVIDRVLPIEQVADAHRAMKGDHFGKIVLKM